jgi:hypothetical protein
MGGILGWKAKVDFKMPLLDGVWVEEVEVSRLRHVHPRRLGVDVAPGLIIYQIM